MNGLHCAATGVVSFDPELKYTQAGKTLLVFNMRVDQGYSATEGKAAPEPIYLRVTAWDDTAEALADTLKKGSSVYVAGKLRLDKWQDKTTGEPKSGLSVSAWRVDQHARIGKDAPPREQSPEAQPVGAGAMATTWSRGPLDDDLALF